MTVLFHDLLCVVYLSHFIYVAIHLVILFHPTLSHPIPSIYLFFHRCHFLVQPSASPVSLQILYEFANNESALIRARRSDPIGPDGVLTKAAEYVPVVNLVVQAGGFCEVSGSSGWVKGRPKGSQQACLFLAPFSSWFWGAPNDAFSFRDTIFGAGLNGNQREIVFFFWGGGYPYFDTYSTETRRRAGEGARGHRLRCHDPVKSGRGDENFDITERDSCHHLGPYTRSDPQ